MTATTTNRKAADALADLRERIKGLRDQEAELRRAFIAGADPIGDDHVVVVETKTNERIDLDQMREHVDEEVWRPYVVSKETVYVSVKRKA
jgi:hypothetical protein